MNKIAVYIHWPYCLKKCPYCDFNSHIGTDIDHDLWAQSYQDEIDYYADLLQDREVTSIFFGGGTPSLMRPSTVEKVIAHLNKKWVLSPSCEITLEANPTSIEMEKFKDFKNAGINRVSVGIQSLRDDQLKFLGREHNASEALKALEIANTQFDRVSFDLIYARPEQSINDWQAELKEAISYAKGHLSLYQLTIEDGTQFKTLRDGGRLIELDYDIAGDMYAVTNEMMRSAGMPAYEISNYAALGQESRHNLTYWRYHDYIGIGPGAHGRITLPDGKKVAARTHKAPDIWMKQVMDKKCGAKPFEILSSQDQTEERIMMGLRLIDGIDIPSQLDIDKIEPLLNSGFLKIDKNRLFVPQNKWPVLDSILAKLLLAM